MIKLNEMRLKKLQTTLLELLAEFDRICRKYNILYSIDGGTLLGAVRHGGFIPWDDDADVIMNRWEYERFLKVLPRELDRDRFYFQDINHTQGYRWGYAKLRRKDTIFLRSGQEHMPYKQGIFLDIFVCDPVPDNYILRTLCNFNSFLLRKAFYSKVGKNVAKGPSKKVYEILALIPEEVLKDEYNRYVHFRNKTRGEYVKCITYQARNKVYGFKRAWYEDVSDMQFENHIFLASKDYDGYLKFMYGDYTKIPDEKDRITHPVSRLKFSGEEEIKEN